MEIVIRDLSDDGARDIQHLLMTLHKDLVTSIIKNDIGHKIAVQDPDINLKHLLYDATNLPGTYLVTVVTKSRLRGLSSSQWKDIHASMTWYLTLNLANFWKQY